MLLAAGAGAAVVTARAGDSDGFRAMLEGDAGGDANGAEGEAAAALDPDAPPGDVFDHASGALDDAETFSYDATVRIEVSGEETPVGPIVVDQELAGDVVLPDSLRESVESSDGLHRERISTGLGTAAKVWRRETAFAGQLESRPWGEDFAWPGELDTYLLPEWLDDVVDPRDGGEDTNGRRVVHGGVPVAVVGEGPELEVISATVELSVTKEGEPRRALLEVATGEMVIEADYSLSGLGDELSIDGPAPGKLDATPWFNEQDLAAFEGPAPMGLSGIPEGWDVSAAYVRPAGLGGCTRATVEYQDLRDPTAQFLWLDTFPPDCATPPGGDPLEMAGFAGTVAEQEDGTLVGIVASGDTAVAFETDLALGDLQVVLATLQPLELAATPEPMAGIPSSGI